MNKINGQCGCVVKSNQTYLCPSCSGRLKKWVEWKILNKKLMNERDAKEGAK